MIDILTGIADFFVSLANFLSNTINSVIWVVTMIPQFLTTITSVFAYAPTPLLVFLEMSVALMVLFAIFKLL